MSSVAERPVKQGREAGAATATATAASAAPAASLVSLPESLHLVIADFLESNEDHLGRVGSRQEPAAALRVPL